MIYPILTILSMLAFVAIILLCERRVWKRRLTKSRAAFADAYNAWKRAAHDPYTGDVPSLYEAAEKAAWDIAHVKSLRGA